METHSSDIRTLRAYGRGPAEREIHHVDGPRRDGAPERLRDLHVRARDLSEGRREDVSPRVCPDHHQRTPECLTKLI